MTLVVCPFGRDLTKNMQHRYELPGRYFTDKEVTLHNVFLHRFLGPLMGAPRVDFKKGRCHMSLLVIYLYVPCRI